MPNFLSPGVYVIEKDISEYSPTLNSSVVGIVGFATKGPVNAATLITSAENLVKTFGKPSESIYGQGLEGALEILEQTNQIRFIRVADDTAVEASAVVQVGACPAVFINPASGIGVSSTAVFKIQATDHNGVQLFPTPKTITVASGLASASGSTSSIVAEAQTRAFKSAFAAEVGSNLITIIPSWNQSPVAQGTFIVNSIPGALASLSVSAYTSDGTTVYPASLFPISHVSARDNLRPDTVSLWAAGGSSIAVAWGATISKAGTQTSSLSYYVKSLNPGTGYNLSSDSAGNILGNSIEVDPAVGIKATLTVNNEGAAAENYVVALTDSSGAMIEDVINTGATNGVVSEYIRGYMVSGGSTSIIDLDWVGYPEYKWPMATADLTSEFVTELGMVSLIGATSGTNTNIALIPAFLKLMPGVYGLAGGSNGISSSNATNDTAIIGNPATNPKEGIYALDDDSLNISVALVPGVYSQNVQNALITLAETTQNFLALVSPPEGIGTAQNAIDWSNGGSDARTSPINSSYAAIYYPHIKVFSPFDGLDRFMDPAVYAARQMAYTDNVSDPWFAPAGFSRGRLTKPTDVEVKLNKGDRDALYSGGNVINAIAKFPQQGIVIFGQRTAQRTPSALDRVNVRRMMIQLRKLILASTQAFVFEPNDKITWNRIESVVNPLLDDIRLRRGITDFRVVCDETTNTPIRIDRNELWCKVIIKPTKTAEMIVFELNLTGQSAKLGQGNN